MNQPNSTFSFPILPLNPQNYEFLNWTENKDIMMKECHRSVIEGK
jgi:hypothetical protein